MKFNYERIPERVVYERGAGALGLSSFMRVQRMSPAPELLLILLGLIPPSFDFLGSRRGADTVRDVRGFTIKFYTEEGNWNIVGNEIPVSFIQDAMKLPDVIHAGSKLDALPREDNTADTLKT